MIQEELKNKEKDIKGITRQACSLLDTAWTKGYVAGFNDGYATRREADKEVYKRPHGKWGEVFHHQGWNYHKCSRCCYSIKLTDYDNFCPNCGEDMREVDNG